MNPRRSRPLTRSALEPGLIARPFEKLEPEARPGTFDDDGFPPYGRAANPDGAPE